MKFFQILFDCVQLKLLNFGQIVIKPTTLAKNVDISRIEVEIVQIPQVEDEKQPEQMFKKSFKVSDVTKQSETLDVTGLLEGKNYRIRRYYLHSLGLKSEISEWTEFSTKKPQRKRQIEVFVKFEIRVMSVLVVPPSPLKWNDQAKGEGIVVEENGRKVRLTVNETWRNVVSAQGFSNGVHSWIVELGEGDEYGFEG